MKLVATETNKTKLKLKHNLPKKYWTSPKFNVFLWEDSYPNSQPPGTPRPTVSLWLFQFHDSKSLHGKWLFNHFQPLKIGWLSSSRQLLIQITKDQLSETLTSRPSKKTSPTHSACVQRFTRFALPRFSIHVVP